MDSETRLQIIEVKREMAKMQKQIERLAKIVNALSVKMIKEES